MYTRFFSIRDQKTQLIRGDNKHPVFTDVTRITDHLVRTDTEVIKYSDNQVQGQFKGKAHLKVAPSVSCPSLRANGNSGLQLSEILCSHKLGRLTWMSQSVVSEFSCIFSGFSQPLVILWQYVQIGVPRCTNRHTHTRAYTHIHATLTSISVCYRLSLMKVLCWGAL